MRIYSPILPLSGEFELPEEESLHAIKVMRIKLGHMIEAFDGQGNAAQAKITGIDRRRAFATIVNYTPGDVPSQSEVVLGIGLPKGDRQRSVIERATELGIDRLVPLHCEHGVAIATDNAIERAKRTVIESCKQSERNRLMAIDDSTNFAHWLTQIEDSHKTSNQLNLLCHPRRVDSLSGADLCNRCCNSTEPMLDQINIAIGPEGGFSDNEVERAVEQGWQVLDLGPLVLRVETAVCVASTLARTILELQHSAARNG